MDNDQGQLVLLNTFTAKVIPEFMDEMLASYDKTVFWLLKAKQTITVNKIVDWVNLVLPWIQVGAVSDLASLARDWQDFEVRVKNRVQSETVKSSDHFGMLVSQLQSGDEPTWLLTYMVGYMDRIFDHANML